MGGSTARFHVYFGGTFDPPHNGHEVILRALVNDAWVAKVHVVPTGRNPLKSSSQAPWSNNRARRELVEAWLASFPQDRVQLETLELDQSDATAQYTVDTLEQLRARDGGEWTLCVGGDIPRDFAKWKNIEILLAKLHSLWVVPRGDQPDPFIEMPVELQALVERRMLAVQAPAVSSTELRALLGDTTRNEAERLQALTQAPIPESVRAWLRRAGS